MHIATSRTEISDHGDVIVDGCNVSLWRHDRPVGPELQVALNASGIETTLCLESPEAVDRLMAALDYARGVVWPKAPRDPAVAEYFQVQQAVEEA